METDGVADTDDVLVIRTQLLDDVLVEEAEWRHGTSICLQYWSRMSALEVGRAMTCPAAEVSVPEAVVARAALCAVGGGGREGQSAVKGAQEQSAVKGALDQSAITTQWAGRR
jgi:hypothetical protein